jgi:hypothetical protein
MPAPRIQECQDDVPVINFDELPLPPGITKLSENKLHLQSVCEVRHHCIGLPAA